MNALSACNKACYDKISEAMQAAASRSGAGIVLVMHVDENGEEIKTFEVHRTDHAWIQRQSVIDAYNNMTGARGHAHICVSIHLYTSARRNMPTSL